MLRLDQSGGVLRRTFQIMLRLDQIGGVLRRHFKTEENCGVSSKRGNPGKIITYSKK